MTAPTAPTPNPAPYARPARPVTVTVSSYLLFGVALVQALGAVALLFVVGSLREQSSDTYGRSFGGGIAGYVMVLFIAGAAIMGVTAIGFVILSILNRRGKNPSRIITWVLAGNLICGSGSLLGDVPGSIASGEGGPSWPGVAMVAYTLLSVGGLLAVCILLALPQSNAYFRKRVAGNPVAPYSGHPGQPGYGRPLPYPGRPGSPSPYPGQYGPPPGGSSGHYGPPQQ